MNTGIPIIDKIIEIFPWEQSKEYQKIEAKYGTKAKELLTELILMPLLNFSSTNDLSQSIGRNKNDYYDFLKDPKIDSQKLLEECGWYLLFTVLSEYNKQTQASQKSRLRVRLIVDDTLIKRWSKLMGGTYKQYNYVNNHFMQGQKLLFLMVTVGDGKFSFPLFCHINHPKWHPDHQTKNDIIADLIYQIGLRSRQKGISLNGVRLCVDSGFTCAKIARIAHSFGIEVYGSCKGNWLFTLANGSQFSIAQLCSEEFVIPDKIRQASRQHFEYYRLKAHHSTLGNVVLCLFHYADRYTGKQRRWVYLSTNPDIDCVTIYQEHRIRWGIEQMFRCLKHFLLVQGYHGISFSGQLFWLVISSFRFIFLQLILKISSRFPSLRWHIPASQFGFSAFSRYIRNHYQLDSKFLNIKRLHYSINLNTLPRKAFSTF